MLDPSPYNELGKGILDPAVECRLLAAGITYAERVFHPDGKHHLRTATTPIDAIAVNVLKPIKLQINSTLVCEHAQKRKSSSISA